jgi:hypothetical protein
VSQNMYMKPGSSELPNGRASSDISAEAVCASSVSGIKSLICAVWEPVDLRDRREALPMEAFCEEASFEDCLGGTEADSRCTGRGWGREGRESWASSRGTEKQQHERDCFGFGLEYDVLVLRPVSTFSCLCFFFFSCKSTKPSRSARVSRLVRPSRIGVEVALGPGLECADALACSRCCQQ